ncbi:hypothetical protein [Desulfogranum mediterraneum]|uniref:hypothetical protein n=1 Tax=Desulfogranum mediterraneum TaxID=160661 RepID=UPI000419A23D|nr:hypothetical protein [Desulfogranum mediterraneum]
MKIYKVDSAENICCPFCDKVVLSNESESEPEECQHTLLIATDEGVEYHADHFDIEELEEKTEELSWDEAISAVDNPKAVLIKTYAPAPSSFGAYYLFEG